jgi:mono/diheme cytochrome c family protein
MSFLSEAGNATRGRLVLGLAVLACGGLLGVGCSSDDSSSTDDSPDTAATGATSTNDTSAGSGGGADTNEAAIALFDSSGCAGCHTLSVADASGAVGPNLDTTSLSKEEIEARIRSGGGAMPPYEGQLSDTEISSLADLISSN